MPKPLPQFLTELAIKAGIKADDAELLALVQNKALLIDVPDALAGTLETNLHTLDSAAPKLKSKISAEVYNGFDAEFDRLMDELGWDENTKTPFKIKDGANGKSIPFGSSTKRAVEISKKIKELTEKTAGKGDDKDKQKYIDEINALKAEKANLVQQHTSELEKVRGENEQSLTNVELERQLSGYNYGLGEIDQDIKITTAKSMLSKKMQEDGVKIIRKDGKLTLVTADGSDYFGKDNVKKDLKSYTDGALAGIIKATEPGGDPANKAKIITIDTKTPVADKNFLEQLQTRSAEEAKA